MSPHAVQPHHLPDPQAWAVTQSRQRADGAVWRHGEYAFFILLWRLADHEAGLVDRCSTCYVAYGETAEAFGQPAQNRCVDCFGSSFDGGIKHRLVRPSLWDFTVPDERQHPRGVIDPASASIQSTSDFRLRRGDYVLRADGTRWQAKDADAPTLRTGFEHPGYSRSGVAFNYAQVAKEEKTSVAFLIPPLDVSVAISGLTIDPSHPHHPVNFSPLEIVSAAPLL